MVSWIKLESLYEKAMELPAAERADFLQEVQASSPEEGRALKSLLGAETPDTLEPVRIDEIVDQLDLPAPPARIGRFRVARLLGKGGMGVVYEAEQPETGRSVALKVIRGSFVDNEQVRMFHREAKILSLLSHPSIATLYESGRTEHGEPFLAMELVRGRSLGDWIRSRPSASPHTRTELNLRLELFRRICDAVAYAHRREVIHRDLKPQNIIVIEETVPGTADGPGELPGIKVLDFGLARIAGGEVQRSLITVTSGIRGTLPYMSPEQVRGDTEEVGATSDVYALGVILYEMMTARLPLDVPRAFGLDAARIICEEAPARIADRASGKLVRDRELQTIVGKALSKTPADRYASATALSEDVRRYLEGEALLGKPSGSLYLLKKAVLRHRLAFGFSALALVLLGAIAIVMSFQADRIRRERNQAQQSARSARIVADFLVNLFDRSDPFIEIDGDLTAREILDSGAATIRAELDDQPAARQWLMLHLGTVYSNLGLPDKAEPLLMEALSGARQRLPEDSRDLGFYFHEVSVFRHSIGQYDEACTLAERALAIREASVGAHHPETSQSLTAIGNCRFQLGQYQLAREVYERALQFNERHYDESDPNVATALSNLGNVLAKLGEDDAARANYERALDLHAGSGQPDSPRQAAWQSNLGVLHRRHGRLAEARPLFERALEVRTRALGALHPDVAVSLDNLGSLSWAEGNHVEARDRFEQALDIRQQTLGNENPLVAFSLNGLGVVNKALGCFEESAALYGRALAIRERLLGARHPDVALLHGNLGNLLTLMGQHDAARRHYESAVAIYDEVFGRRHAKTVQVLGNFADMLSRIGSPAAAKIVGEALEINRDIHGPDSLQTAWNLEVLGAVRLSAGDLASAEKMLEQALSVYLEERGEHHLDTASALNRLARCAAMRGETRRAADLYDRTLEVRRSRLPSGHPDLVESLLAAADLARITGRPAVGERLEHEARAARSEDCGVRRTRFTASANAPP